MIRTQIQITEEQSTLLKRLANQHRQSIAELIRQGIDLYIQKHQRSGMDDDEKWQRALSIVGKYHADVSDLSSNHDEYFAQSIEDYPRRKVVSKL